MKRTGELLTFNGTVTQSVLNTFVQLAIPTGLSPQSNDALLLLGAQTEVSSGGAGGARREIALSRASKTAMPTILDDDVLLKSVNTLLLITSGMVDINLATFLPLPPQALIVVESNMFLQYVTILDTAVRSASMLIYAERVELSDKEKSSILAARLNNLLN